MIYNRKKAARPIYNLKFDETRLRLDEKITLRNIATYAANTR